jgi:alginate O-acetyltransferase complex protein AlgI
LNKSKKIKKSRFLKAAFTLLFVLPLLLVKYFISYFPHPISSFNPTGISFITFIALAIFFDSLKSNYQTPKIDDFLSASFFFPISLVGPIERGNALLQKLSVPANYSFRQIQSAFLTILIGCFQKFAIANRLALYIDAVYVDPTTYSGWPLTIAIFLFSFQIYYDFLGYTNIARGIAKLFNIELSQNFNLPYLAVSLTDFWRRWHMTLSSWLRDYVYIPLGGSRKGKFRATLNVLATFAISGLWHGSTLLFLYWGLLHGLVIVLEKILFQHVLFRKLTGYRVFNLFRTIITFCIVSFLWILFKSKNPSVAGNLISHAFSSNRLNLHLLTSNLDLLYDFELSIFLIVTTFLIEGLLRTRESLRSKIIATPYLYTISVVLLLIGLAFLGIFSSQNFYYERF